MNIDGKRPLATFTDQATGAAADWVFTWLQPDAVTVVNANGQLVPLSGSLKHGASVKTIKDNRGNTVTVFATDEMVTIEIVAVPLGAAGAFSLRDAIEAATFPKPGGWVQISNAPIVPMGSFANVFNAVNWIYHGDGEITMVSDGEWGMRFTLTRYDNIVRAAAVTL